MGGALPVSRTALSSLPRYLLASLQSPPSLPSSIAHAYVGELNQILRVVDGASAVVGVGVGMGVNRIKAVIQDGFAKSG